MNKWIRLGIHHRGCILQNKINCYYEIQASAVNSYLIEGDSIYSTLKSRTIIMVNKHFNDISDGTYVMKYDNNLLVKRLQVLPKGIITVKSDNTMYEPWEINKEDINGTDIELIGRVVWSGQRM
ncbi:S24 family peptidase [Pseudocolwellia agarivorans]|uniref:S24 family peptidase n=1 Tax=Pseudocolwellia agarivorans TaxID=1911682 RepID=UPI003F8827C7